MNKLQPFATAKRVGQMPYPANDGTDREAYNLQCVIAVLGAHIVVNLLNKNKNGHKARSLGKVDLKQNLDASIRYLDLTI
jgi:hypothetical protein